jgi:putative ABC transport system permease protein
MGTLFNDIKFSFRQGRKRPGFALTVVAILALGIGANTAIFNLLYAVLLRPLPVAAPHELALLLPEGFFPGGSMRSSISHSYPKYEYLKEQNEVFSGLLARCQFDANVGFQGQTHRIKAEMISGNYFSTLGVTCPVGRPIAPDDNERPAEHPVAVLSASYWKSHFGKDPDVVGKTILVNGYPLTIVGVSEEGFTGVEPGINPQVRVPLMMTRQMIPHIKWIDLDDPLDRWVQVLGRRRPGVSLAQAQAALQPLNQSFVDRTIENSMSGHSEKNKERYRNASIAVLTGQRGASYLRQTMGKPLWMLMAMVGLVLLLACVNIANLMIGRAVLRQGELAVRNAMGAGRGRLVAQLFIESALLATVGALAGIWAASWTTQLLIRFIPASEGPPIIAIGMNAYVLGFSLVVTFAAVLVFGLLPAFTATRFNLVSVLKRQNTRTIAHGRFRRVLVVAQVSLSLLLLMAGSLFVRSLRNLYAQDPGFQTHRIVAFSVDPTLNGYDTDRAKAIYRQLKERLDGLGHVEASALGMVRVLEDSNWTCTVAAQGSPGQSTENIHVHANGISKDYFATLGISMRQGRDFGPLDTAQASPVAIVNEAFNKRFLKHFPQQRSALGARLGWAVPGQPLNMEIVGIVGDTKSDNMRDEMPLQIYTPYAQLWTALGMTGYVRSSLPAQAVFRDIQRLLHDIDPTLPIHAMRTLAEQRDRSLGTERLIAYLATIFGAFATLLTAVGLYGVLNFSVIRRTQELGLRTALGAQHSNILWIVLKEVLILWGIGTAIALPVAYGLGRFVSSQLYDVVPHDLGVTTLTVLLLGAVAICAAWIPARRAVKIDPMEALRYE